MINMKLNNFKNFPDFSRFVGLSWIFRFSRCLGCVHTLVYIYLIKKITTRYAKSSLLPSNWRNSSIRVAITSDSSSCSRSSELWTWTIFCFFPGGINKLSSHRYRLSNIRSISREIMVFYAYVEACRTCRTLQRSFSILHGLPTIRDSKA